MQHLSEQELEGTTVYVSLEPCSHTGKTGPCADALIASKVERVVCAMSDPAPHVNGGGIKKLMDAGIEVEVGLLEEEAKQLNPGFIKRMQQGLPFVRVKLAMSLDGRTALENGESQWITSEAARKDVHHWRALSDAVITGSETVLRDNPKMTARLKEGVAVKQALRCVVDSMHRVSKVKDKTLNIFSNEAETVCVGIDEQSDWIVEQNKFGKVELKALLEKLAQEEINEVWVEAGSKLAGAFVENNLFDELIVYMAPKLLGDSAKPLLSMDTIESMEHVSELNLLSSRKFGDDWRFIYSSSSSNN